MAKDPQSVSYEFLENRTIFVGTTIRGRRSILLMATGDFGGGSLRAGYYDSADVFRAMDNDILLESDGKIEVPTGSRMKFGLVMFTATNPNVNAVVFADSFEFSGET